MAKKSRRARKRARQSTSLSQTTAKIVAQPQALAQESGVPDMEEYGYVFTDLRRVAILALAIFALLIGLSFFIG